MFLWIEILFGLSNFENEGGFFYGSLDEELSEVYLMNKDIENMCEKFYMVIFCKLLFL